MMINKPMVSILIPCFNQKNSIGRAIESVSAQTYQDKEIVVADDKSTDGSWEYLQKYQNSNCIRLTRNPKNLGRAKNHRHLLYDLARGNYALMLDGDDYLIDNEFVADAVKLAQDFSLGLVFAEAKAQNVKSEKIHTVSFPFDKSGIIPYQEIFKKGVLFMHGAVLYRRDLALKHDFYSKDIIADDNESFLRLIVGEMIGFIKQPVYLYQWDSSPDRYPLKKRLDNTEMVDSVYQHALKRVPGEKKLWDWWRGRMLSTFFYGHLINLSVHKKYKQIREYVTAYSRKYGFVQFLRFLRHPLVAYRWAGYQNLLKQSKFARLELMPKFKFDRASVSIFSELLVNLAAAWLAAILITPNFTNIKSVQLLLMVLTTDFMAVTLCLVSAIKLRRLLEEKHYD